ncbi:ABC transporter permease [Mesorhizobium sp. B2-3-11]|nr:ABC transporter permease [Mesorhizobium sp. B2-3-11]
MTLSFLFHQKKVVVGAAILLVLATLAIFAPLIAPYSPEYRVARSHQAPSVEHFMGTTKMGRDVFSQFVWGARSTLSVGVAAGVAITMLGTVVGLIGGYMGGRVDRGLDLLTNAVLVIPNLPLLIFLAAFAGTVGPSVIIVIITLTSWPWGARLTRSQTLAIKNREFVLAARMVGESKLRVALVEILPNLLPLIGINFVGSIIFAIVTQTTLEYLGFGDPLHVTWGTMLYNAQNSSAILVGAWWDVAAPCAGVVLVGLSLALINFTLDEIANPQLRSGPALSRWLRWTRLRTRALQVRR